MKKIFLILFFLSFPLLAQWIQYPSPVGGPINKIQFFDENSGIIFSDNSLFKTYNGGISWNLINESVPSAFSYYVVDSLTSYIINSYEIFKTQDGGIKWSQLPLPGQDIEHSTIFFISEEIGLLGGSKEHILKTTDGGTTWIQKLGSGSDDIFLAFSFYDDHNGLAYSAFSAFKTSDAGENWTKLNLPSLNFPIASMQFLNANLIVFLAKDEIFRSIDGGDSWVSSFKFPRYQNEIAFADDTTGYVVGYRIYKTTNSGSSWYVQDVPASSYRNIFVLDKNHCWVSKYFDLLTTLNGGGDIKQSINIIFPNTGDTLYALSEIEITWSIDDDPYQDLSCNIKFSSDNGLTWTQLGTNTSSRTLFWTVPDIISDQCKLMIETTQTDPQIAETGLFTIAPQKPITVTKPDRTTWGLIWRDFLNIAWIVNNVETVKIEFSPDSGNTWQTIIDSYPADSLQYKWRLPLVSSGKCLIGISDLSNPSIRYLSANFSIGPPYLNIAYPQVGSVWFAGETVFLALEGDFRGPMKLEFSSDNGRNYSYIDSVNSSDWGKDYESFGTVWNKLFPWVVPNIYSDSGRIKMSLYEDSTYFTQSVLFSIDTFSIQNEIKNALPGGTIWLTEKNYVENILIDKPVALIGKGINQTEITGDTLKPVIIIKSENVTIRNITITAKTKNDSRYFECGSYIPANGLDIINSNNIVLDSLHITGSKDISGTGNISGGIGLMIQNSKNISIKYSKITGADANNNDTYSCFEDNGGDGLMIENCSSIYVSGCEITGGKGGNGYAMGASPSRGEYGGHSLNLISSFDIQVVDSYLKGGIGGKTAPSTVGYTVQAAAGDGAFCDSTTAAFLNSTLEGGIALINNPPVNIPLDTKGGNGLSAVNHSIIVFDGGRLIRGISSEEAMGNLYYLDSTSAISFRNIIMNTSVNHLDGIHEDKSVTLTWNASIGINFLQFEIERAADDGEWVSLAEFSKEDGIENSFKFKDSSFSKPLNFLKYRIKIINIDAFFSYSEEIKIDFLPTFYKLEQNYPNPFNPSTTINYSIPVLSLVTLKIYNMLGKEIAILINDRKEPGNYKINFNGNGLPSGVYFYSMQAGTFSETKKLMLLK